MLNKKNNSDFLLTVIFFGTLWGLIEATLGGFLHFIHFPYTGTVMRSIGFGLMAGALSLERNYKIPFYCAIIAGTLKLIDLLIIPCDSGKVIRPAIAIVSEGMALTLVLSLFKNSFEESLEVRTICCITSVYFSLFIYSSFIISLLNIYPNGRTSLQDTFIFIVTEGTFSLILSTITFLLGYEFSNKLNTITGKHQKLYFSVMSLLFIITDIITCIFGKK